MPTYKITDTTQPELEPVYEHAPTMEDAAMQLCLSAGLEFEEVKEVEGESNGTTAPAGTPESQGSTKA